MSGIYGFSAKDGAAGEEKLHALDVFNRIYGHEGFDAFFTDRWGVGCRLEHFSDQYPASAPILRNGSTVAVVDAVIYNRDELIPFLGVSGNISDEELILAVIDNKGFEGLSQVNGDFSGAVYDENTETWTLFRDHSGIRPLFFYKDDRIFAFSTDIRGLTAFPDADLSVNEKMLFARMSGNSDLSLCETEYKNIRCVHPASWTTVNMDDRGFSIGENMYWKWCREKIRMKSDEEYQAELRRLITDSVRRRADAVPGIIGCELSGGLDSGVIAILLSRFGREGRFYSWSDPPDRNPIREGKDERKIILDICRQENIECRFSTEPSSITLEDAIEDMAVPYMNTYAISKGAAYVRSEGARVMFTGHGGDEGVSHRCNLYELWVHREYGAFLRALYRKTDGKKLRMLRTLKGVLNQVFLVNPKFKKDYHDGYSISSRFLNEEFASGMSAGFKLQKLYFGYDPYKYIMQGGQRNRLDNIAVQGAQNGIRYITPYLDYRVLDFALSIPRAQYHNGYTNRYIYRAAFSDIMPQSLRDMHYKDIPSMDQRTAEDTRYERFVSSKKLMLEYLDETFWRKYLDVEAVKNFELPEQFSQDEYYRAESMLNDMMICCIIQNLPIRTRKWSSTHE